ncbi:IS21-like element helper ATPase IstB [Streptomyces sp. NPDC020412]|uniref:IS21-like element helper ATPase IstB n=1 Tax=Streptomyces sp. NPDC020412 TaxID=3365073 RepID=UPI0037A09955
MTQSTTSAPSASGRWGSFGLPAQRGRNPSDTIDTACRALGLSGIRSRWEEFAAQALREQASYSDFLADLLESECEDRDARRKVRRVKEANFPRPKRIEDFDFSKNPNIPQEVINTLMQPDWVQAGNPLCLIGDSGTGKSHLLIGLGTAIAEAGGRVRYTTAANLVNELAEAASDKQLGRTIKKYGRVDLLCLDELGYVKLDRHGAELLFQIFTEREERHAIAVASNRPFTEWDQTFTDKRLCQAIVDRLTFEAHIIETGTQSFRLASTTAKRKAATAA